MPSLHMRHREVPYVELRSEVQRAGQPPLRRPALRESGFGDFRRHKSHPGADRKAAL